MIRRVALLAAVASLAATGCAPELTDREDGAGRRADRVTDARDVVVYRNIDKFPNLARVCLDGYAWVVTSSSDGGRAPALARFPEKDQECAR